MSEKLQFNGLFRRRLSLAIFAIFAAVLAWRAMDLQFTNREFLQSHGTARYLRTVEARAERGMIVDRNGEPLAVSTPVDTVWAEPKKLLGARAQWPELAAILQTTTTHLAALVEPRVGRDFVYLRRHVAPAIAQQIRDAKIPGVRLTEEQKRFYPSAEVTAHILGFTNVDDKGQEGIELAFEDKLRALSGVNQVIKDRLGHVVEHVEQIRPAQAGSDVVLSIDKRLQYIAYRELKAAVLGHEAAAATMVIIDPLSGEILALVNQPSFNPNNREELRGDYYRNRAVTDVFEPGSTIKPITIAAALESGEYSLTTNIDTAPGYFKVGQHVISDSKDFGKLDLAGIIEKSSNVGASKIALSMEPSHLWRMFRSVGFGQKSGIELAGESRGRLADPNNWRDIEQATLAFGYGMSVNAVQLARAYGVLASGGMLRSMSIIKASGPVEGVRVLDRDTASTLIDMLHRVTTHGTGKEAQVAGYRVAGKTGTVHKSTVRGYAEDRYLSLFAGMIPASKPALVAVVMIDEPSSGEHYGGRVAAPVFANVMRDAVRILNIAPDEAEPSQTPGYRVADKSGSSPDGED